MAKNANAGTVEIDFPRGDLEAIFEQLDAGGRVAFTAGYAQWVNFDTRWTDKRPPFTPLREWVGRVWPNLDQGLKDVALEERPSLTPNSSAHKDAVTWIVVNAIYENGIEGVHFAERALEHGKTRADAIAAKYEGSDDPAAGRKMVEDLVDLMFSVASEIIADEAHDTGNLLQSGSVEIFDSDDSSAVGSGAGNS